MHGHLSFGLVTFDLGAMTVALGIVWTLLCPKYLMLTLPVCACGLPTKVRFARAQKCDPVTFDLCSMTLTL